MVGFEAVLTRGSEKQPVAVDPNVSHVLVANEAFDVQQESVRRMLETHGQRR